MQVTEGRASQPLDAEMAELVWKRLKSLIPQEQMQRIVHVASGDALPATLQKALAVQAFGFAAGHVSKAKSEMHQFSCLRWTMHGTREVAILAYEPASTILGGNKPMSFQVGHVSFLVRDTQAGQCLLELRVCGHSWPARHVVCSSFFDHTP